MVRNARNILPERLCPRDNKHVPFLGAEDSHRVDFRRCAPSNYVPPSDAPLPPTRDSLESLATSLAAAPCASQVALNPSLPPFFLLPEATSSLRCPPNELKNPGRPVSKTWGFCLRLASVGRRVTRSDRHSDGHCEVK